MKKRWIPNPCECCDVCGSDVEIYTDAEQTIPKGACAYDGDPCRCSEGHTGWMTADEGSFYCNWHDDDDNAALSDSSEERMVDQNSEGKS